MVFSFLNYWSDIDYSNPSNLIDRIKLKWKQYKHQLGKSKGVIGLIRINLIYKQKSKNRNFC